MQYIYEKIYAVISMKMYEELLFIDAFFIQLIMQILLSFMFFSSVYPKHPNLGKMFTYIERWFYQITMEWRWLTYMSEVID